MRKRVAVVGAGPCGIAALTVLYAEGCDAAASEQAEAAGRLDGGGRTPELGGEAGRASERFDGARVVFPDGRDEAWDTVVFATGCHIFERSRRHATEVDYHRFRAELLAEPA
jgi:flavin-dependent dehydrogenase